MTELVTRPTVPTTAAPARVVAALRAALPGKVVAPDDPVWDLARRGWVLNVDQRPAAVVTTDTPAEVATAVRVATAHGYPVTAQPVGHGATTALSGSVVLRTRGLDGIEIDTDGRTARVGGGVKWGELLAALEPTGLAAPAGSNPDPSVVGYTLGGGLSWFGRAWGLAAHAVTAFDVVDHDGTPLRVDAATDPERFWAMKGGGGDFGIVTALEMRLFPAPEVFGGRLMWPIEMARPVLQAFREVTARAPEELTLWAHLFRFPPDPAMPEAIRGRSFVSVDVAFLGGETEANHHLTRLRQLPAIVLDTLAPVPLGRLGGIAAEPTEPMPGQDWSGMLGRLDAGTVDRIVDTVGAGADVPLAVVQIRHLGGALARGTIEDGPNGAILEPYQVFALGVPVSPDAAAAIATAIGTLRAALAPELTGRTFFNFLGQDTDPASAFPAGALERLRHVKADLDPAGAFRSHRPVLA
jgi:hypothetical protein